MKFVKELEKFFKFQNILVLAGLIILGFAIFYYSDNKNNVQNGFSVGRQYGAPYIESNYQNNDKNNDKNNENIKPYTDPTTTAHDAQKVSINDNRQMEPPPNCSEKTILTPNELLPLQNNNSSWDNIQINNNQTNFLDSTYLSGINTVSSSLRNANLQLRSEPPNPRTVVCPWNQTTIEPDLMRTPFEIGSCNL